MAGVEAAVGKTCSVCGLIKPLTEYQKRTGRKSGQQSRRGTCKSCVKTKGKPANSAPQRLRTPQLEPAVHLHRPVERVHTRQAESAAHVMAAPSDAAVLIPTRQGMIRMRGRTDKGRRWFQEIDLELAVTLVREQAAVVVNRHTIRRVYSNKDFRKYILTRDKHTCYFCGGYGDTIDHLLPRAKGGHTTPLNCVCACNECNQSKADMDLHEFVGATL